MSYSMTINRRTGRSVLCCDVCGGYPAIKKPCPSNWCQAIALCGTCRKSADIKHKWAHVWHSTCTASSARFRREESDRAAAESAGLPVIKAGVQLPNGRVFAWTSLGNFEVDRKIYHAGIETKGKVLDISTARARFDERPAEVYG